MARALAESMNLATVRLGLDLGLPKVAETLGRLGLETPPTLNPSLLLGTVEMTPLEVVQVYTSLANGGFRARLRAVHAVVDENGRALKSFKVQVEEAAPSAAVYQLDRMLTLVTTHGTGRDAAVRLPHGTVVAGKTGTFLRSARQLVRGIHRQLSVGRLGGLRRQSRDRAHGCRRSVAGVGRHAGETQVCFFPTGAAGARRGSLDRIRRRTGDDPGLQRGCGPRVGAEGHGIARKTGMQLRRHGYLANHHDG